VQLRLPSVEEYVDVAGEDETMTDLVGRLRQRL